VCSGSGDLPRPVMSHKNSNVSIYSKGKPLDANQRKGIVDLYSKGSSYGEISKCTGVTKSGCHKIAKDCMSTHSLAPKPRREIPRPKTITDEVQKFIELEKTIKPSVYCREIRKNLVKNNICNPDNVPSISLINRVVKNDLDMTYKKI